jgi:hypothetical protein
MKNKTVTRTRIPNLRFGLNSRRARLNIGDQVKVMVGKYKNKIFTIYDINNISSVIFLTELTYKNINPKKPLRYIPFKADKLLLIEKFKKA